MKWFRIPKETSPLPTKGSHYREWKEDLSIEGRGQCVYCAINNYSFGGIRNFHVEHYKPKSKEEFAILEHDYQNLYYACSICNCFKGDDWPNEPNDLFDRDFYPDPSKVDYSNILKQNSSFEVDSDFITGKYLIQKIFLNRPQLILERRKFELTTQLKESLENSKMMIKEFLETAPDDPIVPGYLSLIQTALLLINEANINPYTADQIRR